MRVTVVIPTDGRGRYLDETMASVVTAGADADVDIVVAVNGPAAESFPDSWWARLPNTRVLRLRDAGKARAANIAARESCGDIIVFTDDDVLVPTDWVERLRRALSGPLDCVGTALVPCWPGKVPLWYRESLGGVVGQLKADPHGPVPLPAGASLGVRRETFLRVAGFEERLVRGEDFDLARRIAEAGGRCGFLNECEVLHRVEPAMATRRYFVWWFVGAGLQERGVMVVGREWLPPRYLIGQLLRLCSGAVMDPVHGRFAQGVRAAYLMALIVGGIVGRLSQTMLARMTQMCNRQLRQLRQRP